MLMWWRTDCDNKKNLAGPRIELKTVRTRDMHEIQTLYDEGVNRLLLLLCDHINAAEAIDV